MSSMRIISIDGWRLVIAIVYAMVMLYDREQAVPFGILAILCSLSIGEGS